MNESLPQPRLRVSALVVAGLLLLGFGTLIVYGPGMIPLPTLPALPSNEPQVDVVQLPEEFFKPVPRAVVQSVAVPIVATDPLPLVVAAPATPMAVQQTPTPTPAPIVPVKDPPKAGGEPGLVQQLNPFAGLSQLMKDAQGAQRPSQAPTPQAPQAPAVTPAPKRWAMLAEPTKDQRGAEPTPASVLDGLPEALVPPELRRRKPDTKAGSEAGGVLIQPARWAIPEQPLFTIYRSQTLTGMLLQAVHSDMPGQVKIILTTPVLDKFGYDTVILPKDTLIIAVQVGRPSFGSSRLELKLEQLELPTGEVIELRASLGDTEGANGIKGKVNNHLGNVILATGLSALLNIGVKTAAGTPGSGEFFRSPVQEAAQDVGASVQRDASSLIDKTLRIPPTITIKAGTFCTVNLLENMQFNRPPHLAR